jgi:hypothetical protein
MDLNVHGSFFYDVLISTDTCHRESSPIVYLLRLQMAENHGYVLWLNMHLAVSHPGTFSLSYSFNSYRNMDSV